MTRLKVYGRPESTALSPFLSVVDQISLHLLVERKPLQRDRLTWKASRTDTELSAIGLGAVCTHLNLRVTQDLSSCSTVSPDLVACLIQN
jgi:hypothetical protein